MTQANLSLSAVAAACGTKLVEAKGFEAKRQAALEEVNQGVMSLSKAKAVVGQKGKCSIATAFFDALIAGGLSKGTAANYLSTFRQAVAAGKPVVEWNPAQSKGKGGKGKGKGKGKAAFADLLLKAFNHDEGKTFEALCADIERMFEDTETESVYAGFVDYLESEGFEINN